MNKPIRNIVSFSGGKDSTALILWARENLDDFSTVWMDTGWEHDLTYIYVDYIDALLLDGNLIRLKSDKFDGFEDLAIKRKRVPSTKSRFCTQELKIFPLLNYFDTLRHDFEIHNYVGIRADESYSRSKLKPVSFDLDYLGSYIHRPLLKWTAENVFDILKKYDVEPNPLYKLGMKRVGCMPCIMANHTDIKQIILNFPDVIDKIKRLEEQVGRSFFPPYYIPDRYCSKVDVRTVTEKKTVTDMFGTREVTIEKEVSVRYPTVDDVVKYLSENPDQLEIFDREPESCLSHYNICE